MAKASNSEHSRIQQELRIRCRNLGYRWSYNDWPSNTIPDVLRWNPNSRSLFLGDAKDYKNEPPTRKDTLQRIERYVKVFEALLQRSKVNGGLIAIATNNFRAAHGWVHELNGITEGRIIDGYGNGPDFRVEKIASRNWMIYW